MEEVYRLFDRRCRTETAVARLVQLRRRVSRFKWLGRALDKLSSPNQVKVGIELALPGDASNVALSNEDEIRR